MIASIIGNYLKDKGLLSEDQLIDLLAEHRKVRAKLGTIAIAEGLLTKEEADRINRLQAIMDMRFGDIAVEEGYLTEEEVDMLLKKQGNAYLAFAQALENQRLLLVDQLEQLLLDFEEDHNFTPSQMEMMKSDDIDQILEIFLPETESHYKNIAGVAVRALMRIVDQDICIGKGELVGSLEAENGALQKVEGAIEFTTALVGKGNALCETASNYGQEVFNVMDEDALDAVGEIVNCINGLVITGLEQTEGTLDLCPPEFFSEKNTIEAKEILVLPIKLLGKDTKLAVTMNNLVIQ